MGTNYRKGDIVAHIEYSRVLGSSYSHRTARLITDSLTKDGHITYETQDLIDQLHSADHWTLTKQESRTKIVEHLLSVGSLPFTVVFTPVSSPEYRVLRGKLVKPEPLMGRSLVRDFDLDEQPGLRMVDHRTVVALIYNQTLYHVREMKLESLQSILNAYLSEVSGSVGI